MSHPAPLPAPPAPVHRAQVLHQVLQSSSLSRPPTFPSSHHRAPAPAHQAPAHQVLDHLLDQVCRATAFQAQALQESNTMVRA